MNEQYLYEREFEYSSQEKEEIAQQKMKELKEILIHRGFRSLNSPLNKWDSHTYVKQNKSYRSTIIARIYYGGGQKYIRSFRVLLENFQV